jgi:hypothetical protein
MDSKSPLNSVFFDTPVEFFQKNLKKIMLILALFQNYETAQEKEEKNYSRV